jgi:hypothetical protein
VYNTNPCSMAKAGAVYNRKEKGARKKAVAAVILEEDYELAGV